MYYNYEFPCNSYSYELSKIGEVAGAIQPKPSWTDINFILMRLP